MPPNNAAAHVCEEYPNQLAILFERKNTCINAIYESVLNVADALESQVLINKFKVDTLSSGPALISVQPQISHL